MDGPRPLEFAFRISGLTTSIPEERWADERPGTDHLPPRLWTNTSPGRWSRWRSHGNPAIRSTIAEENIAGYTRRVLSIVWSTYGQHYFVTPHDCTQPNIGGAGVAADLPWEWHRLDFHHLAQDSRWSRPMLFQVGCYGAEPTVPFPRPIEFAELLPNNVFKRQEDGQEPDNGLPCHLVGSLPLILALHAGCPSDTTDITHRVGQHFFSGGGSRFVPCAQHGMWDTWDHYGERHDMR